MNDPIPNEEWWLIIARAHREDWNLYESPNPTIQFSDQDETMAIPGTAQANHLESPENPVSG